MRSPRLFPGSASSELLRHMFGFRCQNRGRVSMSINWPESWYGRLRRATASTVVNTAVLPPIPNAKGDGGDCGEARVAPEEPPRVPQIVPPPRQHSAV